MANGEWGRKLLALDPGATRQWRAPYLLAIRPFATSASRRLERRLGAGAERGGIAAERDEGEAALRELGGALAGRRIGAGDLAGRLRPGERVIERLLDLGAGDVQRLSARQRDRHVRGSHEDRVEARHRQDGVDFGERLARLDHGERDREAVRLAEVVGRLQARKRHRDERPPAALADRRELHEGDEAARVLDRVDHRRDDAGGAGVEELRGGLELADRDARQRRLAGSRDERDRANDGGEVVGAVLHVAGDGVVGFARHERRDPRLRDAAPGGDDRRLLFQALAERGDRRHWHSPFRRVVVPGGCGASPSRLHVVDRLFHELDHARLDLAFRDRDTAGLEIGLDLARDVAVASLLEIGEYHAL